MSEQKHPLWKAMDDGMEVQASKETGQTDPLVWRRIRAAEIRALRDWLVPFALSPGGHRPDPDYEHCEWAHAQRLRALLAAEADRAECGDQPTSQEH